MVEIIGSYALASLLGFGTIKLLRRLIPYARFGRIALFAALPLALLFAAFLAFFEGNPVGEDWVWLGVGLVYFWPWYLAWWFGWLVDLVIGRVRGATNV
ncbi:MAG: hypothetical protein WBA51_02805 [Erythrobacter sp.]